LPDILTRSARRAARNDDCATVRIIGRRVAKLDRQHHARVFVLDPTIARCLPTLAPPPPAPRRGPIGAKVGVGIGAPYGGEVGISTELRLAHAGLVGSIGIAGRSLGWSVGLRTYLRDRFVFVRPHVTTVYGTTSVYVQRVASGMASQRVRQTLRGVGVYVGVDIDIGEPGALRVSVAAGVTWQPDDPVDVVDESWVAPYLVAGFDHEW
jgi:hypothetical protein